MASISLKWNLNMFGLESDRCILEKGCRYSHNQRKTGVVPEVNLKGVPMPSQRSNPEKPCDVGRLVMQSVAWLEILA